MPWINGLRPSHFPYRGDVVCEDSGGAVSLPPVRFHSDGTVQQANPDAGDANTSDSIGMGVWVADGDGIKGKFVEVTADRTTRQFVSRGEISFSIKVNGNAFSGTASAIFYDTGGRRLREPLAVTLEGKRVVP
jgi:hypothetical protein